MKHFNLPLKFLFLSIILSNNALAVTYTCQEFGNSYQRTFSGYSDGGFAAITSSCNQLIDQALGKIWHGKKILGWLGV
jgi:hypothetical protein